MSIEESSYQGMVILGASGNVGTRLVERTTEGDYPQGRAHSNPELLHNPFPHQHPTLIIGVADSQRYYVDINGIEASMLRATEDTKANIKGVLNDLGEAHNGDLTLIVEAVQRQIVAPENAVGLSGEYVGYVDLTDSVEAKAVYEQVLGETESGLVAVSKEVLGHLDRDYLWEMYETGRLQFKPTVGAGMDSVQNCLDSADGPYPITSIEAMISGTCLGLCKGLESEAYQNGKIEFSDLLREQFESGNTEPIPHKDVGEQNTDVHNKMRILGMSAYYQAKREAIHSGMPFVPQSIGDQFPRKDQVEDYLQAVAAEVDKPMRAFVEKNITQTHTIRHIGRLWLDEEGNEQMSVGLEQEPRDSEFGRSDQNVIILKDGIETRIQKKEGAGRDVTSKSVEDGFKALVPKGKKRRAH